MPQTVIVFFYRKLNRSLFVPDWPLLFSDLRHSRMLVWWVYRSAGRGQPSSLASLTAFSAGLSTRDQEENMEPDMRITLWKCDCRIIGLCTRYSTLAAPTPWGVRYYILQLYTPAPSRDRDMNSPVNNWCDSRSLYNTPLESLYPRKGVREYNKLFARTWPISVIRSGSPPNCSMLSTTHCRAATWSINP